MENEMLANFVKVKDAPEIPNLVFRKFVGEQDYPHILNIIEGCKDEDGIERTDSLEEIQVNYEHLVNSDPYQDVTFVEIDGNPVGYSRVFWERLGEGIRTYTSFGFLIPEWRRRGIGTAMLQANEAALRRIAADHPVEEPRFYQSWAADTEVSAQALLENSGYEPIRHAFELVRDLSDPIPNLPLPEGLEVRPVEEAHIWPIFQAADEAFKDHWGYRPTPKEEFESWMKGPDFRPELWKVAWDGDQIAGSVQNFYNPRENQEYDRKRGYTEGISTRRPWRKRGLASALIAQSMRMFKEMGMTETAHGVDAQNISGALNLYKKLGYKVVKQYTTYRKPMDN
jgi:GNAT superfamily N-acetyltransferase